MKVKLRVYKYKETLDQEFSNMEEAQTIINQLSKINSDSIYEPYIDLNDTCSISIARD